LIENKVNENIKEFNYLECDLSQANNGGVYNKVQKFQYKMEQWDTHYKPAERKLGCNFAR